MKTLKAEHHSKSINAKTLVVFGGNEERRNEIITLLMPIENLNIYGTLSQEEGIEKLKSLDKVDIVLIGGRYTLGQREKIKNFISEHDSQIKTTEPGIDYTYSNENIFNHIKNIINTNNN